MGVHIVVNILATLVACVVIIPPTDNFFLRGRGGALNILALLMIQLSSSLS